MHRIHTTNEQPTGATAARPRLSRPALHLGSIYLPAKSRPLGPDPSECASVRRQGLGLAVTFSLRGSSATIIIKVYPSGPAQTDFTPFAIRQLADRGEKA